MSAVLKSYLFQCDETEASEKINTTNKINEVCNLYFIFYTLQTSLILFVVKMVKTKKYQQFWKQAKI